MDTHLKTSLWLQFGVAVNTLDDTISLCPDCLQTVVLWKDKEEWFGQFWLEVAGGMGADDEAVVSSHLE